MEEREELKRVFLLLGENLQKAPWDTKFEIVDCMLKIYKAISPESEKDAAKNTGNNNFINSRIENFTNR